MKKMFYLLLLVFVSIGLVSCYLDPLISYKDNAAEVIEVYKTDEIDEYSNLRDEILEIMSLVKNDIRGAKSESKIDDFVNFYKTTIDEMLYSRMIEEFRNKFHLTDKKVYDSFTIQDDFTDNEIIISLKRAKLVNDPSLYPKLEIKHLRIDNIIKLRYLALPLDIYFTEGYEEMLGESIQIVLIEIYPRGKEEVLRIIKILQELDFIKNVSPNMILHGGV